MSKFVIIGIIVLAIIAGVYFYLESGTGPDGSGEVRLKEYTVQRGTFETSVTASGVVVPIDRVEIKSKASGNIEALPVEEGDFVRRGELICRLDQTDVKAEVEQARANQDIAEAELKLAENTYARQKQLFEKGLIAQDILDDAELTLAQAKGRMVTARTSLDQANVRLSETVVRAPIDGVILQKYVEVGQIIASGISNVSGGTPIADIADMSKVHIEAGVDEIDVGRVRVGQKASVMAEAFPRRHFAGEIIRIAPEAKVEQNVTLFDVVVQVDNEDGLLKSGMNATVTITIEHLEDVLLVPTLALGGRGQGPTRQVRVRQDGQTVEREIEISRMNFQHAVVVSGLSEGDTLVVPMISRLMDENERLEERIRSSRSFGSSGSSSNNSSNRSGGR